MYVEVLVLLVLPPAVAPLEHEAADGVAGDAEAVGGLTAHVLVEVGPLPQQVAGLGERVFPVGAGVEGVGAELGVEHRDA